MQNELAGFVMCSRSGTVGVVESNTETTATLYVLHEKGVMRAIVPTKSLDFLPASENEWQTNLKLFTALPADVQKRPEMQSLLKYTHKIFRQSLKRSLGRP